MKPILACVLALAFLASCGGSDAPGVMPDIAAPTPQPAPAPAPAPEREPDLRGDPPAPADPDPDPPAPSPAPKPKPKPAPPAPPPDYGSWNDPPAPPPVCDARCKWEKAWAAFDPHDPAILPTADKADGNINVAARYRGVISGEVSPHWSHLADPEIELNVLLGTYGTGINARTYFNGSNQHMSSYSTSIRPDGSFDSYGPDNLKGFNGQFYDTDHAYGMVRGTIRTPQIAGTFGAALQ